MMYCLETGQNFKTGGDRPLVFLHGWSAHGGYFTPQVDQFAAHHPLLIPDLPGHRHSAAAQKDLGIHRAADALHALLDRRDLRNAVLIGWSMGAMVAFDYIARHGAERLSGLVIEDMTVRILNDEGWPLGIRNGFNATHSAAACALMRQDWAAYISQALPRLFAWQTPVALDLMRWTEHELLQNDGDAMAMLWEDMARQDYRDLLPDIDLPTLLLHGDESQLYAPDVSTWIAARLPRARSVCIVQAGHSPHLEQPAAYNRALADFITSL